MWLCRQSAELRALLWHHCVKRALWFLKISRTISREIREIILPWCSCVCIQVGGYHFKNRQRLENITKRAANITGNKILPLNKKRTSVFPVKEKKVEANLVYQYLSLQQRCQVVFRLANKFTATSKSWKLRLKYSAFQNKYRLSRLRTITQYSSLSLEIVKISYTLDYLLPQPQNAFFLVHQSS